MDCKTSERIAFQQQLFTREHLAERWPALNDFICSADTLEVAYAATRRAVEGRLTVTRGTATEALAFYNAVVEDGRYIGELLAKPEEVARKLDLALSPEVAKHLTEVNAFLPPGAEVMNIAVVAVAVAVTVVIVKGSHPMEELVINQSGLIRM